MVGIQKRVADIAAGRSGLQLQGVSIAGLREDDATTELPNGYRLHRRRKCEKTVGSFHDEAIGGVEKSFRRC